MQNTDGKFYLGRITDPTTDETSQDPLLEDIITDTSELTATPYKTTNTQNYSGWLDFPLISSKIATSLKHHRDLNWHKEFDYENCLDF